MRHVAMLALSWLGLLTLGGTQMGGCGSTGAGLFVSYVVVVNQTDSFVTTLVGLDYDGTVDRVWRCDSPQANVTIGGAMYGGSVRILIEDDAGTVVYDNVHSGSVGGISVQTMPGGVPGFWHVVLDFNDAGWSGAITLTADDPPTKDSISIGNGIGTSDSYLLYAEWDTDTVPVHVSLASGLSAGQVRIRLWDPDDPIGSPTYDAVINTGTGAVSDDIDTAAGPGIWMIQIDCSGTTLGSAISISN